MFDHRPIFGHIRFSFYGRTDTRSRPSADDEALTRLYDETRIARRFFLFENLTLPSLMAQTDKDFTTVILSSEIMPDRFKERLLANAARLPGAVVHFSSERTGDRALAGIMAQSVAPKGLGTSVHFRLDDDDALAQNYIARLRSLTRTLSPSTHITFPTGILLFPANPGSPIGTSMPHQRFLTAIGLATVNSGTFIRNPFQMQHSIAWTRWPLVSDPGFPAFIRTQHFENDTIARQDKVISGFQRERRSRRAKRHEAAVDAALNAGFPFIHREKLDGLLERCDRIKSLADLEPVT